MLDKLADKFFRWLENIREERRRALMHEANRKNIENLALGADGMGRQPMKWR